MKNLYDESIMWGTLASVKNIDNKLKFFNKFSNIYYKRIFIYGNI